MTMGPYWWWMLSGFLNSDKSMKLETIDLFVLGFRSRGFLLVGGWVRAGAGWFMGYHITFHFRGTISSQGGIRRSKI